MNELDKVKNFKPPSLETLHGIVQKALLKAKEPVQREEETTTCTFRVKKEVKVAMHKILKQHGLGDSSLFLRLVIETLVAEYRPTLADCLPPESSAQ